MQLKEPKLPSGYDPGDPDSAEGVVRKMVASLYKWRHWLLFSALLSILAGLAGYLGVILHRRGQSYLEYQNSGGIALDLALNLIFLCLVVVGIQLLRCYPRIIKAHKGDLAQLRKLPGVGSIASILATWAVIVILMLLLGII